MITADRSGTDGRSESQVPAGEAASPTPYADALQAHAERDTVRLNVPGYAGDAVAAPRLAAFPDFLRYVAESPGGHVRGGSDRTLRTLRVLA